jgi:ATP-dependent DNA helicase RecQ
MDLPDNPESYYQEAGRAGRDEKLCYGVILYNEDDVFDLERKVQQAYPDRTFIRRVYAALSNYLQVPIGLGQGQSFTFEVSAFCQRYTFEPIPTLHALQVLELAEYIGIQDAIYLPARIRILVNPMNLYRFQVEQPSYDTLIKVLLRSYSGLFDDYVLFSEKELAKRTETNSETLRKQLIYLRQIELIDYHPATDEPSLTFLEPRVPEAEVRIPSAILEDRKTRAIERMKAMLRFLNDRHQCRSVLLLSYFGEKDLKRCGICDVCRERNKLEMNDLEVEEIMIRIGSILSEHPLHIQEIAEKTKNIPSDKLQAVLRWMIDTGELKTDAIGRFMFLQKE